LYPGSARPSANNGYGSVFFHILPYIEQDNAWKLSLQNQEGRNGNLSAYDSWNVRNVITGPVKTYVCPMDPTVKTAAQRWDNTITSYAYNGNVFGISMLNNWGQGS